jgi:hypothetical protein
VPHGDPLAPALENREKPEQVKQILQRVYDKPAQKAKRVRQGKKQGRL